MHINFQKFPWFCRCLGVVYHNPKKQNKQGTSVMERLKTNLPISFATRLEELIMNWFIIVILPTMSTWPFSINNTQKWVRDKKSCPKCTRYDCMKTLPRGDTNFTKMSCCYVPRLKVSIKRYTTIENDSWRKICYPIDPNSRAFYRCASSKFATGWYDKTWTCTCGHHRPNFRNFVLLELNCDFVLLLLGRIMLALGESVNPPIVIVEYIISKAMQGEACTSLWVYVCGVFRLAILSNAK